MVLRNHIAYRFLTDFRFFLELFEEAHPALYNQVFKSVPPKVVESMDDEQMNNWLPPEMKSLHAVAGVHENRSYIIANTVLDGLNLLKVDKKENGHYDWSVFKHLKEQKKTFIFPQNNLIRFLVREGTIHIMHLSFIMKDRKTGAGKAGWVMSFLDQQTGDLCHLFESDDMKKIEEFMYKFLCFFYLSELQEEIIPPGRSYGTKKTGKVINDLPLSVTIVNSKWNITSIRTEGFAVSGHFRVQPVGEGRTQSKIIFIEPFKKNGYKRRASKHV